DNGTVTVQISDGKTNETFTYDWDPNNNDSTITPATLAAGIGDKLSKSTLVNSVVSGNSVNLVAKKPGSASNYSVHAENKENPDPDYFPSFSVHQDPDTTSLKGGYDNLYAYDSGSISFAVNGKTYIYRFPEAGQDGSAVNANSVAKGLGTGTNGPQPGDAVKATVDD